MRVSSERTEELKAKIRQILTRIPNIGSPKLAELIGVEQNYALKLLKGVRKENAENINQQTILEEVGKLEMEFNELMVELWKVVGDVEIDFKNKLRAIMGIIDAKKTLFQIKFDAGVFQRKLGELKIEEPIKEEYKNLVLEAMKNIGLAKDESIKESNKI